MSIKDLQPISHHLLPPQAVSFTGIVQIIIRLGRKKFDTLSERWRVLRYTNRDRFGSDLGTRPLNPLLD